jgi:hypothetical protein
MNKYTFYSLIMSVLFLPFFAHAEEPFTNIARLLLSSTYIVQILIGICSSIALLVFIWGLVKYIASAADEKAKDAGKRIMINGVIALTVLFSVFGLVEFLQDAFDIDEGDPVAPPQIRFP